MRKITTVETTIKVELTAQDILQYVSALKIVPEGTPHYSVNVIGKGVSQGATLVVSYSHTLADQHP